MWVTRLHQSNKLVTHIHKGLPLATSPKLECKDLPIEAKCLLNVANLERDVVQANKPCLVRFRHPATSSSFLGRTFSRFFRSFTDVLLKRVNTFRCLGLGQRLVERFRLVNLL